MVTGWKLAENTLMETAPDPEFCSYNQYLEKYVKPT